MSDTTPNLDELITFMDDEQTGNNVPEVTPPQPTEEPAPKEEEEIEPIPNLEEEEEETPPEPTPASTPPVEEEEEEEEETGDPAINAYYEYALENGVISPLEDFEFDGTEESLSTALAQTKENLHNQALQAMYQTLPDEFKPVLEYVVAGGTDVNKFLATSNTSDLETIDIEDLSNQRKVMKEYLKSTTKYNDKKIDKLISRYEVTDSLEEEAVDALEELKELKAAEKAEMIKQAAIQKQQREQLEAESRTQIASTIDSAEFITSTRKGKVKAFLYNPIKKGNTTDTDFNRTLQNIIATPEHFIQLADMLMDYDPKRGISLDRVAKKQKTKATSNFKKKLDEMTSPKSKVSGKRSKTKESNFDWNEFLKQN